ncbi:hypothetical protein B0T26DRAFT_678286 [Lasiosphaeria miniovina]|uniref:DUF676 domain-containing protein n=1 Tax=Lasiosphaeria miniovina TaxID=1954250 RepID=A0AA40DS03_9PEZI|nr:uncharacterized protein B0T26DRAFT_678286 [Lasiosphaeria miniovina]KAK0714019.1 hypothetical protein B0T26DRAFT_678286 [Lasiosphaeria miniovina]
MSVARLWCCCSAGCDNIIEARRASIATLRSQHSDHSTPIKSNYTLLHLLKAEPRFLRNISEKKDGQGAPNASPEPAPAPPSQFGLERLSQAANINAGQNLPPGVFDGPVTEYPAEWAFTFNTVSENPETVLVAAAKRLLAEISAKRQFPKQKSRPIVFVAHSFGGILVKKAIMLAENELYPCMVEAQKKIEGVVFLGTPHFGFGEAFWKEVAMNCARAYGMGHFGRKDWGKRVKAGWRELNRVTREWLKHATGPAIEVRNFSETTPVNGVMVVPDHAAGIGIYKEHKMELQEKNHCTLTQYVDANDTSFKLVAGEVLSLAFNAWMRNMPPPVKEPEIIRPIPQRRYVPSPPAPPSPSMDFSEPSSDYWDAQSTASTEIPYLTPPYECEL